jgi:biotin-(acetyl-CoA carboxylase) ligase
LTLDGAAAGALTARDALVGTQVETEEHGAGVARGIDSSGALVLERPDGSRVSVVAGSVRVL